MRAKDRRALENKQRAQNQGGESDFASTIPAGNQRQNRQFAEATKQLTIEEADRLHREVSGKGYPYEELKRLADEIVLRRSK